MLKGLGWLFLLLISVKSQAIEPNWQVLPDTCVVENAGDLCDMSLTIVTQHLPAGVYCLTLSGKQLDCVDSINPLWHPTVHFRQTAQLALLDSNNNIVFTTVLKIKTLQSAQGRRRIRSPWSIF
ncbi:DUF3019 domain-containing protein [Neptunicella sp.]|uniref:DUF3019 domain-containing protein n=1 Tax=Neptunicella sp. TaxID=2125986 RepID=UPI003F693770